MLIFALAYWCRNFSFVFWENWNNQKAIFEINWLLVVKQVERPVRSTNGKQTINAFFYTQKLKIIFTFLSVVVLQATVDTVQDFLIKLGIKPHLHLWKISFFSLYNDLVRLTKIMNNHVKDLKILGFKVIYQCLKLVESFQKKIL